MRFEFCCLLLLLARELGCIPWDEWNWWGGGGNRGEFFGGGGGGGGNDGEFFGGRGRGGGGRGKGGGKVKGGGGFHGGGGGGESGGGDGGEFWFCPWFCWFCGGDCWDSATMVKIANNNHELRILINGGFGSITRKDQSNFSIFTDFIPNPNWYSHWFNPKISKSKQ